MTCEYEWWEEPGVEDAMLDAEADELADSVAEEVRRHEGFTAEHLIRWAKGKETGDE